MTRCEDGSGPAFPVIGAAGAPEDYPGMSLRDYFAAKALAAHIGNFDLLRGARTAAVQEGWGESLELYISRAAYEYADAMLKAREA